MILCCSLIIISAMNKASTFSLCLCIKANANKTRALFGGFAPPLGLQSHEYTIKRWSRNKELNLIVTEYAACVLERRVSKSGSVIRFARFVRRLCSMPKFIYALRATNYMVHSMLVPDAIGESHYLFKMATTMIEYMRPKSLIGRRGITKMFKPIFTIKGDRIKSVNMPSFERHSFVHKFLTPIKRLCGSIQNSIITTRWEESVKPELMTREVNPDRKYAKRLATMEELRHNLTLMDMESCMVLLQGIAEHMTTSKMKYELDKNINLEVLDVDLLMAYISVNETTRSRFNTKVIDVSYNDCTCHTKCMGRIGNNRFLENMFREEILNTSTTVRICGQCRLSHVVDNTTSAKPRKCINISNPAMSTCSQDGCTTTMLIRYLINNQHKCAYNKGVLEYGHRFYMTNSSSVTDTVYKGANSVSSATGRSAGICFSGSRTCYKPIKRLIKSSKQHGLNKPFSDRYYWWTCNGCQTDFSGDRQYNKDKHHFFTDAIHEGTCIDDFYTEVGNKMGTESWDDFDLLNFIVKDSIQDMCTWCKNAAMCRHTLDGLVNLLCDHPTSNNILRKLNLLISLQLLVKSEWDEETPT